MNELLCKLTGGHNFDVYVKYDVSKGIRNAEKICDKCGIRTLETSPIDNIGLIPVRELPLYSEFESRLKALEDKIGQSHEKYDYVDNNMSDWVKDDVQWVLDRGILVGNDGKLGLSPIKLWTIAIIIRTARYTGKHMNMKL